MNMKNRLIREHHRECVSVFEEPGTKCVSLLGINIFEDLHLTFCELAHFIFPHNALYHVSRSATSLRNFVDSQIRLGFGFLDDAVDESFVQCNVRRLPASHIFYTSAFVEFINHSPYETAAYWSISSVNVIKSPSGFFSIVSAFRV